MRHSNDFHAIRSVDDLCSLCDEASSETAASQPATEILVQLVLDLRGERMLEDELFRTVDAMLAFCTRQRLMELVMARQIRLKVREDGEILYQVTPESSKLREPKKPSRGTRHDLRGKS